LDWHPTKGLLASGSKDNLLKLWDPKTGKALTTLHGHKHTITGLKWNKNGLILIYFLRLGNWLLSSSRDCILRLFDIRTMKEIRAFRGHEKEVTSLAWHPQHDNLFASGGADGSILFWDSERDESVGGMESAHDNGAVWSLAWHPLGHILASGSNDFSTRFWTRHRPGDVMRERYDMSRGEAESLGLLNAAFHDDGKHF
jgi:polyadenylation factor subunit 2